jgi:integrase
MTFQEYATRWTARRAAEGLRSVDDDRALLDALLPTFGGQPLESISRRHVRAWVSAVQASGRYAPRTVLRWYRGLQAVINAAVADDVLPANTTRLTPRELPPAVDADPFWRARARYTEAEVRALITDVSIAFRRRLFYACAFATGLRFGELAGLTWGAIGEREPLDVLIVGQAWSTRRLKLDATKTRVSREVPILSSLSRALERWADRWPDEMGRDPGPGDLVFPSRASSAAAVRALRNDTCNATLTSDLRRLGFDDSRTIHAMRRTFIDLLRGRGARKDVVALFTHAKPSDMIELYSEVPWPARCDEIERIAPVFEVLR